MSLYRKVYRDGAIKDLDGRMLDIVEALNRMKFMPGFPNKPEQVDLVVECLAAFCDTQDIAWTHEYDPEDPDDKPDPDPLAWRNPLRIMLHDVASTFEFFPPPIKWRMLYQEAGFTPLDGRDARTMLPREED